MAGKSAGYMKDYRAYYRSANRLGLSVKDTKRALSGGLSDSEAEAVIDHVFGNRGGVTPRQKNVLFNQLTGRPNWMSRKKNSYSHY